MDSEKYLKQYAALEEAAKSEIIELLSNNPTGRYIYFNCDIISFIRLINININRLYELLKCKSFINTSYIDITPQIIKLKQNRGEIMNGKDTKRGFTYPLKSDEAKQIEFKYN